MSVREMKCYGSPSSTSTTTQPATPIKRDNPRRTQSQAHDDDTLRLSCPYGHGSCSLKVSRSQANPGRPYYTCSTQSCRFFKWASDHHGNDYGGCGQVGVLKRQRLRPQDYPECRCGAGKCKLVFGKTATQDYFVCPIEKGHGACSFRAQAMARPGIVSSVLNEGSPVGFEHPKRTKFDSTGVVVVNNPPLDQPSTSVNMGMGNGDNEPEQEQEQERELEDVIVDNTLQVSCLKSDTTQLGQTEYLNQISADPMKQMLGRLVLGWLGRLAFPPSGTLMVPQARPFFGCVFPSFDPINAPKAKGVFSSFIPIYVPKAKGGVDTVNYRALNEYPQGNLNDQSDTTSHGGILMELSSIKNVGSDDYMGPISKALGKAGLLVQKQLLSILESTNPANHNSMREAANKTFSVLKLLSMDHREFSESVRKFISCAAELAKIEDEWRKKTEVMQLPEEIEDWYENEKAKFDEMAEMERETMAAIAASDKQVECIGEEVMRLREKLAGMEKELRHRNMENGELKWRAGMIREDMTAAKKKMEEARAAKMVHEERSAAMEALERARFHLRHNH
ncbi:uncharacterized protein LOC133816955 [Humulus lupulus]|uniref:uncharacterized protein LOC133816955 n=1 Tax=Humulus lupulus TaxID=3486 RepID=UPI002B41247F|nr:uncharacterized protein LOC133816955 [Humulus lupulus]